MPVSGKEFALRSCPWLPRESGSSLQKSRQYWGLKGESSRPQLQEGSPRAWDEPTSSCWPGSLAEGELVESAQRFWAVGEAAAS